MSNRHNKSAAAAIKNDFTANTTTKEYSSDEESPYAPALRKAQALHIRRAKDAQETVRTNLLFEKMGIQDGFESDDSWESPIRTVKEGSPNRALLAAVSKQETSRVLEEEEETIAVAPAIEEIAQGDLLDALQQELFHRNAKLEQLQSDFDALKDQLSFEKEKSQSEVSKNVSSGTKHQAIQQKCNAEDSHLASEKTELLECQLSVLEASRERAEKERAHLAVVNDDLRDTVKRMEQQLKMMEEKEAVHVSASHGVQEEDEKEKSRSLEMEVASLKEQLTKAQQGQHAALKAAEQAAHRAINSETALQEAALALDTERRARHEAAEAAVAQAHQHKQQHDVLVKEIEKLSSDANAYAETLESTQAMLADAKKQVAHLQSVMVEKAVGEASALEESKAKYADLESILMSTSEQLVLSQKEVDTVESTLQNELTAKSKKLMETEKAVAEKILDLENIESRAICLQDELDAAQSHAVQLKEQLDASSQELANAQQSNASLQTRLDTAEKEAKQHALMLSELSARCSVQDTRASDMRNALALLESEKIVLESRIRELNARYNNTVESKYGLVERRRCSAVDASDHRDLEVGDASSGKRGCGAIESVATRFGVPQRALPSLRFIDDVVITTRDSVRSHPRLATGFGVVYFVLIHAFLAIMKMQCAPMFSRG